jgi:hypothetical protein
MKKSVRALALSASVIVAFLLVLAQVDAAYATSYSVSALGTLEGYTCSQAIAVTNSGLVLTSNSGAMANDRWAIWNSGAGLQPVPVPEDISIVRSINSSGMAVGSVMKTPRL